MCVLLWNCSLLHLHRSCPLIRSGTKGQVTLPESFCDPLCDVAQNWGTKADAGPGAGPHSAFPPFLTTSYSAPFVAISLQGISWFSCGRTGTLGLRQVQNVSSLMNIPPYPTLFLGPPGTPASSRALVGDTALFIISALIPLSSVYWFSGNWSSLETPVLFENWPGGGESKA